MRQSKALSIMLFLLFAAVSEAEVVLDGTMGRAGSLAGPNFLITGDIGRQVGGNLFHSFSSFNVQYGESATFSGPASVQNIISRVTGGSESTINGLMSSTIPGADLYFLNPAGVFFGPGARLDLQGSFYVSTADYLKLGPEGRFDASNPGSSLLVSAPPSAFGFLQPAPAAIFVDSSRLQMPPGRNLSIISGDLLLDNAVLWTPDGRITIAGIASQGEVATNLPQWNTGSFSKLGELLMYGGYIVAGGGEDTGIFIRGNGFYIKGGIIESGTYNSTAGGAVDIRLRNALQMEGGLIRSFNDGDGRGGDLRIDTQGLFLAAGASAGSTTLGSGDGGNILINASEMAEIAGADAEGSRSGLFSYGGSSSTGRTGSITITTPSLDLADGGLIIVNAGTYGSRGDLHIASGRLRMFTDSRIYGRNILLDADNLVISGGSYIWSPSAGPQESHTITVNASESIVITGERQFDDPWRDKTAPLYTGIHTDVFINADGNAGDINIKSPLILITDSGQIGARTYTDGQGGNINIEAGRIELYSGGQVGADSFGSSIYRGPSGNITVRAGEAIVISGENGELESGFSCNTRSSAGAGLISVTTPLLSLSDHGQIAVTTGVFGEGRAGEIVINAGKIELLSNSSINSASRGHGLEGSIRITASESIFMDGGHLVSFGDDEGKAGHIYLKTPQLFLKNASSISTLSANELAAGDITIEAGDLALEGKSAISSESLGSGKAGEISITATGRLLSADSSITTEAGFSTGGNILINASDVLLTGSSRISATVGGGSGNGGNVSIWSNTLAAIESSTIAAKADQGFGGNIALSAEAVIFSKDSEANASSNVTGKDGIVEIKAPALDISGFLAGLASSYLRTDLLLPGSCAVRDENTSSFIITGRETLPSAPGGFRTGR